MKKLLLSALIICSVATIAFAQDTSTGTVSTTATAPVAAPATETIKGTIIDNMCAGSQKPEMLSEFVKTHTKECATQPTCAASGYSIYADGKLMKFDEASNQKISDFLKTPTNKLEVVAEVKKAGEELSLVSIKNQE